MVTDNTKVLYGSTTNIYTHFEDVTVKHSINILCSPP